MPSNSAPTHGRIVFIVGPPAVGKMTVGQELARLTGFKLFYNHRIIDLLTDYFPFGSPGYARMAGAFYEGFFEEAAAAELDIIAALGWDFSSSVDEANMRWLCGFFSSRGGSAVFAELSAPLAVRLARNGTPNRRSNKKVEWATDEELRRLDEVWQSNSNGRFPLDAPHLVIDNTDLAAGETAALIREHFDLPMTTGE